MTHSFRRVAVLRLYLFGWAQKTFWGACEKEIGEDWKNDLRRLMLATPA